MPRDLAKSVRHCSADSPFPMVIPLERPEVASKIQYLQNQRNRFKDASSAATPENLHSFYSSLMDAMFSLAGVDGSKYPKCVDVCIAMCKSTNVYKAIRWKRWDGLRAFNEMMKNVDRLTRETNVIHCPAAPYLMMVIVINEVVLFVKEKRVSNDKIAGFLRVFDYYNKAASAICYFDKGNRQNILALDQPWFLTASVQRPPTRLIDQSEFTISSDSGKLVPKDNGPEDVEMDEDQTPIKIESSPEREAETTSKPQATPHAIQDGLHAATQPGSLGVGARLPATNQYTPPFEHQNTSALAGQATASRDRRHEGPMPTSMPRDEHSTQYGTHLQVTRAEVMVYLQPLLDRLKHEDWAGRVQDDIMCILTERSVKVIPAEAKGMLGLWAGKTDNGTVLTWLEQAKEDLTVFQWIERNEAATEMLWYTDRIHTIFRDINVTIGGVSELNVQEELRAQVGALRDIIFATNM